MQPMSQGCISNLHLARSASDALCNAFCKCSTYLLTLSDGAVFRVLNLLELMLLYRRSNQQAAVFAAW